MPTLDEILDDILEREGGYVDDPDDPGGATKHGVSLRYAKGLGLDNDGDGDTDKDDIRLVTIEQARELYVRDFYYEPKLDQLPDALQPQLFDMSVNHGPARAVMILQEIANEIHRVAPDVTMPLEVDGRIGPLTRTAALRCSAALGSYLVNAIAEAREAFYRGLAERNPAFRKYVVARDGSEGGWIRRARSFRVAATSADQMASHASYREVG